MAGRKTSNLQNITLSADKDLIKQARIRAAASKTTLNEEFRNWLKQFSRSVKDENWFREFMKGFKDISSGRKFRREEFYEE